MKKSKSSTKETAQIQSPTIDYATVSTDDVDIETKTNFEVPTSHEILRITRLRWRGKQYLTYVARGVDEPQGISKIHTYRKYKEYEKQEGGVMIPVEKTDYSMITNTREHYDIPYTKEKALELMENCKNNADDPVFLFKEGLTKIVVNEDDNFLGDFDEVMKKSRKGEVV